MKTICLCSSRMFFDRLWNIKDELEKMGYGVLLPSMQNFQETHLEEGGTEDSFAKIHYNLIRKHFTHINNSDAIIVCNFDKKGIKGYIGGNSLIEMGKAFDKEIPIFLLNPVPEMDYKSEILAMNPIILGSLDKIKEMLK